MGKGSLLGGSLWEQYSQKVSDRMNNPKHAGELTQEEADKLGCRLIVADYGAESCGDAVRLFWIVDAQGNILKAKFKSFGCGTAIAASDMMVELCIGKTIEEVLEVTNIDVEMNLRDSPDVPAVPPQKMHCSVMAYDVIKEAAAIYYGKKSSDFEHDDMVCECARVRLHTIKDAIKINNLTTVEQITQFTKAGAFCKSCIHPGGHEKRKYYLVDILRDTRAEMENEVNEMANVKTNTDFASQSFYAKGKMIEAFMMETVMPYLEQDGGSLTIEDMKMTEDNRVLVSVRFHGACASCAGSSGGTLYSIDQALKTELSDLIDLELVSW